MTPAKQESAAHAQRDSGKPRAASDPLKDCGDALLRGALEACRHHERVARLIEKGSTDEELHDAAAICDLADHHLAARTREYETCAAGGRGKTSDDFWRAANTLWHASCEYARRHGSCDALTMKLSKHSSEKLGALALEFELEASALLALRQSIAAYKRLQPDAE
jgi:hypothetical protein